MFLSLVKVFFSFSGFLFLFHCSLSTASCCISACCRESIHNRDGPGGVIMRLQCLAFMYSGTNF